MNEAQRILGEVRRAVREARATGLKMVRRVSGDGITCCCPMRATILAKDSAAGGWSMKVARELDVSESKVWSFVAGVDDFQLGMYGPDAHDSDFYQAGKQIAAEIFGANQP